MESLHRLLLSLSLSVSITWIIIIIISYFRSHVILINTPVIYADKPVHIIIPLHCNENKNADSHAFFLNISFVGYTGI